MFGHNSDPRHKTKGYILTPRFRWESGFNHQLILNKIADCRSIDSNNRCSFFIREYRNWLPILESALEVSSISERLKHNCVVDAVNDPHLTLQDKGEFLRRCDVAYVKLTSGQRVDHVLLMPITYSGSPLFNQLRDGDVVIRWQTSKNSRFMKKAFKQREEILKKRPSQGYLSESSEFTYLRVHVPAQNLFEAHERATDAVDCLRGILNLLANSHKVIDMFTRFSPPHAINRFRHGPFRTVHRLDGSLLAEIFWYENQWMHQWPTVRFRDGGSKSTQKNIRRWWDKLQQNPLQIHIRQGLLRYCRALDLHESEPALLELWGALESLTGTQREKYDITVNRTAKVFAKPDEARQLIQHFRSRRNATIHAARSILQEQAEMIIFQAEEIVGQVLVFCLDYGRQFSDHRDLISFLDLPSDQKAVIRNIKLSKVLLQYHRENFQ